MNNGTDWSRYDQPGQPGPVGGPQQPQDAPPGPGMYGPGEQAYQGPGGELPRDRRTWFGRWFESPEAKMFRRRNRHTIIAMLIALLLILLLVTIGFGYTLLTVIFLTIAYIIGGWFDGNPRVYRLLQRFF